MSCDKFQEGKETRLGEKGKIFNTIDLQSLKQNRGRLNGISGFKIKSTSLRTNKYKQKRYRMVTLKIATL